MTAFDNWIDREISRGLIGLHLTVRDDVPGRSPHKVQEELLRSERALQAGRVREAPRATSVVASRIAAFVGSIRL